MQILTKEILFLLYFSRTRRRSSASGVPEAIRILAARTTFEEAWQSGSSGEALKARYDFKHVSASEACRQHGNLYQVRFIRKYRALLAFSNDGKQCWWLDVFPKQNEAEQERRIESACDRALRLLEQHQS